MTSKTDMLLAECGQRLSRRDIDLKNRSLSST